MTLSLWSIDAALLLISFVAQVVADLRHASPSVRMSIGMVQGAIIILATLLAWRDEHQTNAALYGLIGVLTTWSVVRSTRTK